MRAGGGAGPPEEAGRRAGGADRDLRPLRLQQVALGGVLGPVLPDRVAQGALPGRVHGGAALVGNRQHRQGGAVHQRGPRAGLRGAAARRERVGVQVHGGGRPADPLRPGRGAQRGRGRHRVDHRGRGATGRSRDAGRLRRADRPPALQQAGARVADRRRRLRLARRAPQAAARGARRRRCGEAQLQQRSGRRARSRSSAKLPAVQHRAGGAARRAALDRGGAARPGEGGLGFFISGHPLERYREEVELFGTRTTATLRPVERAPGDDRRGGHGGQAADLQEDRQGIRAAGAGGLPRHGGGDRLPRCLGQAQPGHPARRRRCSSPAATATATGARTRRPFIVEAARPLDGAQGVRRAGAEPPLAARRRAPPADAVRAAAALCTGHPGPTPLYIEWSDGNGESVRLRSRRLRVARGGRLVRGLRELLGSDAVHYVKAD